MFTIDLFNLIEPKEREYNKIKGKIAFKKQPIKIRKLKLLICFNTIFVSFENLQL